VENIPFMHVICNIAIEAQGMGKETFATVFVAFSLSTICVGFFFYLLGHYELGNAHIYVYRYKYLCTYICTYICMNMIYIYTYL
jgi:hypothetical protein